MNKKNVLVSSLMFGLLMVSAAQCPSKPDDEKTSEQMKKDVDCLKDDIRKLLELDNGEFDENKDELVKKIRGCLEGLKVDLEKVKKVSPEDAEGNLNIENFVGVVFVYREGANKLEYADLEPFRVSSTQNADKKVGNGDFLDSISLDAVGKLPSKKAAGNKK